jgi:secreted PhoX family phosphatase
MAGDYSTLEDSNTSRNPSLHELSDPSRRVVLRGGAAGAVSAMLAPLAGVAGLPGCASPGGGATLGFKSVPVSTADALAVPEGYSVQVMAPWGDPVGLSGDNPAFKADASNTAAEQEAQLGMHHDGIHYFAKRFECGLLVMVHEH